jgi:hypothetical protein
MVKNKINKEKRKLFQPIRLIILLLVFLGLSFTTITLSREPVAGNGGGVIYNHDGYRIDPGFTEQIRGVSADGEVCAFKNKTTDRSYFIPTRFQHEWNAVKTATHPAANHFGLELLGCDCNLPWGGTIFHGESVIAYNTSSVDCGSCPSEIRYCNNKILSGSYTFKSCTAGTCPSGYYCDYLNNACIEESVPCTAYTCDQLSSLAAANEGLNCGLGLNDGCGGTINCINNCLSGQVCASCPIGIDDYTCYDQPQADTEKGVCLADTTCNAVIDVAGINNRGRSFCVITHEGPNCPASPSSISNYKIIRHINNNCEIYPVNNNWADCGNHFPDPSPYWVSFDGENTKAEILATPVDVQNDIIIETCTPTGGGGTGPDPEQPE